MSTLISPSNKSNIITYKNKANNNDYEKDIGNDNGSDSSNDSDSINEGYDTKMIYTHNEPQIRYVY